MKGLFIICVLISVLFAGCDMSSVWDQALQEIMRPAGEEADEYFLQSGDPSEYFGFEVNDFVFEDSVIKTDYGDFQVQNGKVLLGIFSADIIASRNCITISKDGLDPVVYIAP